MNMMYLDERIATVERVQKLEKLILDIITNFDPPNPVIQLVHANGNILTLFLSQEECSLGFTHQSLDPPYYASLGHPNSLRHENLIEYMYGTHVSEIPKRHTVDLETLLEAAKQFHETGLLPSNIDWEEV
jgi:hypothetical protein